MGRDTEGVWAGLFGSSCRVYMGRDTEGVWAGLFGSSCRVYMEQWSVVCICRPYVSSLSVKADEGGGGGGEADLLLKSNNPTLKGGELQETVKAHSPNQGLCTVKAMTEQLQETVKAHSPNQGPCTVKAMTEQLQATLHKQRLLSDCREKDRI